MKKIKLFLVLFCIFLFASCKTKNIKSDIKELKVETLYEEKAAVGQTYTPSEFLTVYAIYQDDSKVDVTKKTTFVLDTQTAGIKQAEAKYLNTVTYFSVTVINYSIPTIDLGLAGVKTFYQTGEHLDVTNLQVTVMYPDGRIFNTLDFDIDVYDNEGNEFNYSFPFMYIGEYSVKINYEDKAFAEYTIQVSFSSVTTLDFEALFESLPITNGRYQFLNEEQKILDTPDCQLYIKGNGNYLEEKNSNNQPVSMECNGILFSSRLTLDSSKNCFRLVVEKSCEVSFILATSENKDVLLYSYQQEFTAQKDSFDKLYRLTYTLPRGTYYLKTDNSYTYIYDLSIVFDLV